jgi:replicative DNA helicase
MYAERLPPHDIEAEEATLGSILIDSNALNRVVAVLKPDDFYRERNRFCYEACLSLFSRNEAINQVTVTHELDSMKRLDDVGGPSYLSHLVSVVPTPLHAEHYARIVNHTAVLRSLIQAGSEIAALGYDGGGDVEGVLSRAENIVFRLRTKQPVRDFVSIRDILERYQEEKASVAEPLEQHALPVQSGFQSLDDLLGGFQRSDLVILAARPGFGKSSLALNISLNAARAGQTVGVFSLEMSRQQLALRLLSSEAGVDGHRLRIGLYSEQEEQRVMDAIGRLSDLPIYIDDTPLQTVVEMRSKARRLHQEHGLDLLIVDYIGLVLGDGRIQNRVQELSDITRALKGLSRDLNVVVVAVSQLSRAVEGRTSHRPQLSDLRDSGSIEQDADVVMFIYREDKYSTLEEWEIRVLDRPYPQNIAELIVAKHRHGPEGSVNLFFRDQYARFEELAKEQEAVE